MILPAPEKKFMLQAIEAAKTGRGNTGTNPLVGACLVENGKVLATAAHEKFGAPHAEAALLDKAGEAARGADLYCTLEPCIHTGKTPPCLPRVLASKPRRVIIAHEDPHPAVAGAGLQGLLKAGVEVVFPLARKEYRWLNRAYFYQVKTGMPWLDLKLALSSDGYIATEKHHSKWLSGPESRYHVHELRNRADAVMVGAGTVRRDNPSLTVRHCKTDAQPLAVIVTTRPETLELDCKLLSDRAHETIMVLPPEVDSKLCNKLERRGVTLLTSDLVEGSFCWDQVLKRLSKLGIGRMLIEGGGGLAGSLVSAGYVNEAHLFYCGRFLGRGIGSVRLPEEIAEVGMGPFARLLESRPLADDVYIRRLFDNTWRRTGLSELCFTGGENVHRNS